MKTVRKAEDTRFDRVSPRLAGGLGAVSAMQDSEALLRRATLSCLLWENAFYESGESIAKNIAELIPQVEPRVCAEIARETRFEQKLRHVPLYITAVMAGIPSHKAYVSGLIADVVQRADELAEYLAIYWKLNGAKTPISAQSKRGLATAFGKFNEYQFAKYRGDGDNVKLRDVMRLVRPVPANDEQAQLYGRIKTNTMATPETWEVLLSSGKDKKTTWEYLISSGKLGALAFLRNLRNMEEANVSHDIIQLGFDSINTRWLLPLNYLSAAKYAPRWESQIETLMFKGFEQSPKLSGYTVFIVDVSGSTSCGGISEKSGFSWLDGEAALAMLGVGLCEKSVVYATAGNDGMGTHKTMLLPTRKGFGLIAQIKFADQTVGSGGIFTRQAIEYVKEHEQVTPERLIVLSDSQDCERTGNSVPKPFAKHNYIINVSSHARGVAYRGAWDAEISGWSEKFIPFIAAVEGLSLGNNEEDQ
jgi:60 kDa SS-A/Ro ribonucleoprotein